MDYGHHRSVVVGGVAVALTDLDDMHQTLDVLAKALTLLERIEALRAQNTLMSVQLDKSADHMSWAVRRLAKKAWRYACQIQQHID